MIAYERDYAVYITRLDTWGDVFHNANGLPVNLLGAMDNITKEGIEGVKLGTGIDFDYTPLFMAYKAGSGGVKNVVTQTGYTKVFRPPLQMEAEVEYEGASSSGGSGNAVVKLYNLNRADIDDIKVGDVLTLEAGYKSQGSLFTAFVGMIDDVQMEGVGSPDKCLVITCSEGSIVKSRGYAQCSLKFPARTPLSDVFISLIEEFNKIGIPEGQFQQSAVTTSMLSRPYTINKPLGQALTDLCNMVYYTWLISNGKLYILPKDADRPVSTVNLTSNVVVGDITRLDTNTPVSTKDKTPKPMGVKITQFFSPNVRPENHIAVTFGQYAGTYKPVKINYELSYRGDSWYAHAECQPATTFNSNQ